jgi:hypothetical protein
MVKNVRDKYKTFSYELLVEVATNQYYLLDKLTKEVERLKELLEILENR